MLESNVKSKTIERAKEHGWRHHNWVCPGRRGVPDNFFTRYPRQIIFIEFKRDDDDAAPRTQQLREHRKLREQGFEVFVVNYVEEGYEIFDAR
jgi:hypothetical protein